MLVPTNICQDKRQNKLILSQQTHVCHNKNIVVLTTKIFCHDKRNVVATKVLSRQAYFCHSKVLSQQNLYLWQLLPIILLYLFCRQRTPQHHTTGAGCYTYSCRPYNVEQKKPIKAKPLAVSTLLLLNK